MFSAGRSGGRDRGAGVCGGGSLAGLDGLGTVDSVPFLRIGFFGDEAVGEEAEVLVVADDEVIEDSDVKNAACFDEFGSYFFVGFAWFGVAVWVVVYYHDCFGKELVCVGVFFGAEASRPKSG